MIRATVNLQFKGSVLVIHAEYDYTLYQESRDLSFSSSVRESCRISSLEYSKKIQPPHCANYNGTRDSAGNREAAQFIRRIRRAVTDRTAQRVVRK